MCCVTHYFMLIDICAKLDEKIHPYTCYRADQFYMHRRLVDGQKDLMIPINPFKPPEGGIVKPDLPQDSRSLTLYNVKHHLYQYSQADLHYIHLCDEDLVCASYP